MLLIFSSKMAENSGQDESSNAPPQRASGGPGGPGGFRGRGGPGGGRGGPPRGRGGFMRGRQVFIIIIYLFFSENKTDFGL